MAFTAQPQQAPRWTLAGFRLGAVAALPLLPGVFAFGVAFGTVAARKGLTLADALAMSATVCAGLAQIVVVESWPGRLTFAAIAGMTLITAIICMRFLVIGASLRPWLGGSAATKVYPSLFLLTEPNWILSMRYRAQGGSDAAYFAGSGAMVWLTWVLSTAPGYWLGAAVGDPHRFGLDLPGVLFRHAGVAVAECAARHQLGGRRRGRGGGRSGNRRVLVRAGGRARRHGKRRVDR
jgi:predicted branched-subunit amino acid permease